MVTKTLRQHPESLRGNKKKEKSVSFIQLPFSLYTNKLNKKAKAKHSLFSGRVKDVFRHFPKRINK